MDGEEGDDLPSRDPASIFRKASRAVRFGFVSFRLSTLARKMKNKQRNKQNCTVETLFENFGNIVNLLSKRGGIFYLLLSFLFCCCHL